jgi:hypothetical protein
MGEMGEIPFLDYRRTETAAEKVRVSREFRG